MNFKTTVAALAFVLSAGAAIAQTAAPATPARPAAPAAPAAPAMPAKAAPAAPAAAMPAKAAPAAATPAAKTALINVNTATAAELDGLPQIGPARSKAIIDNRVAAKGGAYKDIADLEKRADLPSNAIAAIKDKIKFR